MKGSVIFHRGDPVEAMHLVRSGTVALERSLTDGGGLTLQTAQAGDLVAQASLFAPKYHCDGICTADTTLAVLSRRRVLKALSVPETALAALTISAHEVQTLRARVEIMRQNRVSQRLGAYLALYGPPARGEWVRVADFIGISAPALCRELARLRRNHVVSVR